MSWAKLACFLPRCVKCRWYFLQNSARIWLKWTIIGVETKKSWRWRIQSWLYKLTTISWFTLLDEWTEIGKEMVEKDEYLRGDPRRVGNVGYSHVCISWHPSHDLLCSMNWPKLASVLSRRVKCCWYFLQKSARSWMKWTVVGVEARKSWRCRMQSWLYKLTTISRFTLLDEWTKFGRSLAEVREMLL